MSVLNWLFFAAGIVIGFMLSFGCLILCIRSEPMPQQFIGYEGGEQ